MPRIGRHELVGAVFTDDLTSVSKLRERGVMAGAPTLMKGPDGEPALTLDGTNDYWVGRPQPNMQAGCTVMSWVYVDPTETTGIIWAKRDNSGKGPTLIVDDSVSAGDLIVYDGGDVWVDSGANIVLGAWHHVAVVVNAAGTDYVIYYDGVLATAVRAITPFTPNEGQPWSIGADDGGFAPFKGAVRDFMAYPRELAAAEILGIFNSDIFGYDKTIVSGYDMSNINPKDVGGVNSNDGTGTGLVAADDIVRGPFNQERATQYNGTDERTAFGDVGDIRALSLMVRPDTTTEELVYIDTGKDIMVSGGTVTYTGVTATATFVDGVATTAMIANVWQHLVCVLTADVDADLLGLAYDGANFGAITVSDFKIYSAALLQIQAADLRRRLIVGSE